MDNSTYQPDTYAFGSGRPGAFNFTLLFEDGFFVIEPTSLFLIAAFTRTASLYRSPAKVITTASRQVKSTLLFAFIALNLTLLILWAITPVATTKISVPAACLYFVAAVALFILSSYEHARSVAPSTRLSKLVYLAKWRTKVKVGSRKSSFARKKVLILDDVFSGIDADTEHIFCRLFSKSGLLRRLDTTAILVTRAVSRLLSLRLPQIKRCLRCEACLKFKQTATEALDHAVEAKKPAIDVTEIEKEEATNVLARQTGDWILISIILLPQVGIKYFTGSDTTTDSNKSFMIILGITAAVSLFALALLLWQLYLDMIPRASIGLHQRLLNTVLGAPLSFFPKTDSGTTLNRFSENLGLIDNQLPNVMIAAVLQLALFLIGGGLMAATAIYSRARVRDFVTNTESEAKAIESNRPPAEWPSTGAIEILDFSASYSESSDRVVEGISLTIRPGEKLGICGRSGSGKSSPLASLFYLLEFREGSITIDGEDTAFIPREAVNIHTDSIIQAVIREEFRDCTIISVAHRPNTLVDFDRIVVLHEGRIVEFGAPQVLLSRPGSWFKELYEL
ncbi:hypothetical protein G7Y89_g8648 [Cudoniella acicularis]|uniref:ABC transmembrane type-1 domain-containing protein n=1 Tax=Cudoniella acicularis TaxID=354080 RepID=A0A8H4RG65_9HELO|nr:hypothetical protein G7Y89_g8648 [Cudoniella acicularis]